MSVNQEIGWKQEPVGKVGKGLEHMFFLPRELTYGWVGQDKFKGGGA